MEPGSEAIWNLELQAKLCCTSDACSPCILIIIQLNSSLVEDEESDYEENVEVWDQDDNGSESRKPKIATCKQIATHVTRAHVCVFCSEGDGVLQSSSLHASV